MKKILINTLIIFIVANIVNAQEIDAEWRQIIEEKPPQALRMHSNLYHLAKYVENDRSTRRAVHKTMATEMISNEEDRINVEIVFGEDLTQNIDRGLLDRIGANVKSTWKNRASCWLLSTELMEVAKKLPEPYVMMPVFKIPNDNEGPGLMNSDSYNTGSANGNGVRIAVLDSGFDNLTEAIIAGAAPLGYGANYDWTGSGLQSGTTHGTNCLETVFDHAPGSTYYLHKIGNTTDMGNAVDQAISDGVDVITHSISRYNTGWDDNSGPACSAAQDAVDAGILFFTSAGNRNGTHWQGNLDDDDNDNWHEWSGSDEANNFTVGPDGVVRARLQWNGSSFFDQYDLFLYDASNDNVLASSTSLFSFEILTWTNPSSFSTRNVYLAVRDASALGASPAFEVFNHDDSNGDFQFSSNSGSTTSPSNCTSGNVISVGAVPEGSYTSAAGTNNIIAGYSSLGPSNNGNSVLDLVGPTLTQTTLGNFSGTSCATPNAAGAAAAFWSGNPNLTATGVRQILFRKADLYNDWGSGGYDNTYGRGGLALYDHYSGIRYILNTSGNFAGNSQRAYRNMQQADGNAPNNARVVFLGGTYAQPQANFVFTKSLLYVSAVENATVE